MKRCAACVSMIGAFLLAGCVQKSLVVNPPMPGAVRSAAGLIVAPIEDETLNDPSCNRSVGSTFALSGRRDYRPFGKSLLRNVANSRAIADSIADDLRTSGLFASVAAEGDSALRPANAAAAPRFRISGSYYGCSLWGGGSIPYDFQLSLGAEDVRSGARVIKKSYRRQWSLGMTSWDAAHGRKFNEALLGILREFRSDLQKALAGAPDAPPQPPDRPADAGSRPSSGESVEEIIQKINTQP